MQYLRVGRLPLHHDAAQLFWKILEPFPRRLLQSSFFLSLFSNKICEIQLLDYSPSAETMEMKLLRVFNWNMKRNVIGFRKKGGEHWVRSMEAKYQSNNVGKMGRSSLYCTLNQLLAHPPPLHTHKKMIEKCGRNI